MSSFLPLLQSRYSKRFLNGEKMRSVKQYFRVLLQITLEEKVDPYAKKMSEYVVFSNLSPNRIT